MTLTKPGGNGGGSKRIHLSDAVEIRGNYVFPTDDWTTTETLDWWKRQATSATRWAIVMSFLAVIAAYAALGFAQRWW